jgi:hypothetical protein
MSQSSIVNYLTVPAYIVSEQTETDVITITPASIPTIQNYDYFSQTIFVVNEPQSSIVSESTYVTEITVY